MPASAGRAAQYLWLALDGERLWLLHDAHRHPAHRRHPSQPWLPRVGGVWDWPPRHGLVLQARELRGCHQLELSWPDTPRLIVGRVYGPREDRRRLVGLLAADELGLRAETESHVHG